MAEGPGGGIREQVVWCAGIDDMSLLLEIVNRIPNLEYTLFEIDTTISRVSTVYSPSTAIKTPRSATG